MLCQTFWGPSTTFLLLLFPSIVVCDNLLFSPSIEFLIQNRHTCFLIFIKYIKKCKLVTHFYSNFICVLRPARLLRVIVCWSTGRIQEQVCAMWCLPLQEQVCAMWWKIFLLLPTSTYGHLRQQVLECTFKLLRQASERTTRQSHWKKKFESKKRLLTASTYRRLLPATKTFLRLFFTGQCELHYVIYFPCFVFSSYLRRESK